MNPAVTYDPTNHDLGDPKAYVKLIVSRPVTQISNATVQTDP